MSEPGPFGPAFIGALVKAGIIPPYTQKVIIEASLDTFVKIHVSLHAEDGDALLRVVEAEANGAVVVYPSD